MADNVIFQTDDALSEENLGLALGAKNSTQYVESGLDVSISGSEADVTAGIARLLYSDRGIAVEADARTGAGAVSLPVSNGVNYVYLVVDLANNNAVTIEAKSSTQSYSNPALLIAEVDTSTSTVTPKNRDPDATFESVSTDGVSIGPNLSAEETYSRENLIDGDTAVLSTLKDGNKNEISQIRAERNETVSTSSVEILSLSATTTENKLLAGVLSVQGREKDGSGGYTNTQFTDVIAYTAAASPVVLGSAERGTPASRTYSATGGGVELAMGSGEYAVVAVTNGGTPDV